MQKVDEAAGQGTRPCGLGTGMTKKLRVFISSPGDVGPERQRAAIVISRLRKEFSRFFDLSAILWEYEPMLASGHFQDVIEAPSKTDIVVMILWSRLGTPLPARYRGLDGRTPVTGTEWEFEDALRANRERGSPDLLVYRKTSTPQADFTAKARLRAMEEQWAALEEFWSRHFMDSAGGFKAGFHGFPDLDSFERQLEEHLRALLRLRLPDRAAAGRGTAGEIAWHQGSPFRGLQAFEPEHAAVFFGRAQAEREVTEALLRQAEAGPGFLLVLGASGSGKSSLVKAGVLPQLAAPGVLSQVAELRHVIIRPGESGEDPIATLATALLRSGLPELAKLGVSEVDLARQWRSAPQDAALTIRPGLIRAAEDRGGSVALLIVIDQLEELFTLPQLDAGAKEPFIAVLAGLAQQSTHSGRAWVIATMRSDLYHRVTEVSLLVKLAHGAGLYHLAPARAAEIEQMVRQPAAAAGLDFELDEQSGLSLDGLLLEAASKDGAALPLLEFALDELYRRDIAEAGGHILTIQTYRQMGELEGAIAARAEEICLEFTGGQATALPAVLRALVTIDEAGHRAAHSVPRAEVARDPDHAAVVDGLIRARLVVASGDALGSSLRLTHEALLTRWPRLDELIESDIEFLRTRTRLRADRAMWSGGRERDDFLLPPGRRLAEAEDLLARRALELDPDTTRYVERSIARDRAIRSRSLRRARRIAVAMTVLALGAAVTGVFAWDRGVRAKRAEAEAQSATLQAQIQQSNTLAALSSDQLQKGDAEAALNLAVQALPTRMDAADRPIVPRAIDAAKAALASDAPVGLVYDYGDMIAISPDGSRILSASGRLAIWNSVPLRYLGAAPALSDSSSISSMTVSPDGRHALITHNDGSALLLDYLSLPIVEHELVPPMPEYQRISATFSSDGRFAIVSPAKQGVGVWRVSDGQFVTSFNPFPTHPDYSAAKVAANSEVLEIYDFPIAIGSGPDGASILVGGNDGVIRCWDIATGKERYRFRAVDQELKSITTNPAGTVAISTHFENVSYIWQIHTDRADLIQEIRDTDTSNIPNWSPDGRHFVTQNMAGEQVIRNFGTSNGNAITITGQRTLKIGRIASTLYSGIKGRRRSFSDDGTAIIAIDETQTHLNVWDIATGNLLERFGLGDKEIRSAAWTHDLTTIALATTDGIAVWRLPKLESRVDHVNEESEIIDYETDGRFLVTIAGGHKEPATEDNRHATIWDTKRPIRKIQSVSLDHTDELPVIRIYARYNAVLLSWPPLGRARAIDLTDGTTRAAWQFTSSIDDVQLVNDDKIVVTAEGKASLVDPNGRATAVIDDIMNSSRGGDFTSSTDGRAILLTKNNLLQTTIWFPLEERRIELHSGFLMIGHDGLFLDDNAAVLVFGGAPELYTTDDGRHVRSYDGLTEAANTVDASADGRFVAAGDKTGQTIVWSFASGEILNILPRIEGEVNNLKFSPDGNFLYLEGERQRQVYSVPSGVLVWNDPMRNESSKVTRTLMSDDMTSSRAIGVAGQHITIADHSLIDGFAQSQSNSSSAFALTDEQVSALAKVAIVEELTPTERQQFGLTPRYMTTRKNVTDCDRLTSNLYDPERAAPGLPFEALDPGAAIPACEAALKADPSAARFQYGLGRALYADDRVDEALVAFRKAADSGYPMAWVGIGAILENETSSHHDVTAARRAFEKAAEGGVSNAVFYLGRQLWSSDKEADKQKAVEIWKDALDFSAEKWLGDIYAEGKGAIAPKDETKALYHYIRAGALVPQDFRERSDIIRARGSAVRAYALKFGLRAAADEAIKALASLEAKTSE
jgi:WD40 repeat protein/tetratricopeptide (TPR) repeat protein